MSNMTIPFNNLIDFSSGTVKVVSENWVLEKDYEGCYADLSGDEELRIIEEIRQRPWREVIAKEFAEKNPWLYRIIVDEGRSIFLKLLDFPKRGTYLDIGSGWGQISLPLGKHGTAVALDLTANRLKLLQEIAIQEQVNMKYVQGNFLTFPFKKETFEMVVFNGSLEWLGIGRDKGYSIRDIQLKALKKAYDILKPGGIAYIGIENSIGLKYLLGAPDDHNGFDYISFLAENAAHGRVAEANPEAQLSAKTWSLEEYRCLTREAGFAEEKVYCCFPDYKLIRHMVDINDVNNYLIKHGLPYPEHNGINGGPFGREREMDTLYRLFALNGIAQYFSPSYGFILRKGR